VVLKDDAHPFLDELAVLFQKQPGLISVEGHTDNQPIANDRFPSNWELSAGRASRVTRYLIDQGVMPEHIQTVGYADTRPRASNDTEEGRRQNRRVSLVIYLPDVAEGGKSMGSLSLLSQLHNPVMPD
jgi:chemotaxis protein MotB